MCKVIIDYYRCQLCKRKVGDSHHRNSSWDPCNAKHNYSAACENYTPRFVYHDEDLCAEGTGYQESDFSKAYYAAFKK
ncbi:hypothetical protein PG990_012020 [Apiospora arundinis]